MSLNGNGPARLSAYADPQLASIPYMEKVATGLKYGHISIPPFPNQPRATSIFVEEAQLAILGRKAAQQAMDDAVARVKPLL
jgi:multiple sugar transport system substrate-binding protein